MRVAIERYAEVLTKKSPRPPKLDHKRTTVRAKAQKRGKELEDYISLSKQQEVQLSKLRKSAAQEERRHADEIQEMKLKHVQELYIAKRVSSMRGGGVSAE